MVFICISYLTQEISVHFATPSHMSLRSNKLLEEVCWQFMANESC